MLLLHGLSSKHVLSARRALPSRLCGKSGRILPHSAGRNSLKFFLAAFSALLVSSAAYGVDTAVWDGAAFYDQSWDAAPNWKVPGAFLGGVPTGTAIFDGSARNNKVIIGYGRNITIQTLRFAADAKEFNFSVGAEGMIPLPTSMTITGRGIVNEGSARPKFRVGSGAADVLRGTLCFANGATAGNAILSAENFGKICFLNNASAGEASIQTDGKSEVEFGGSSSADRAQITVGGGTALRFKDNAAGGKADIKLEEGGTLDIGGRKGTVEVGSVNGKGAVALGGSRLTVGNNGKDSELSGKVSGGGSLGKIGGGTLKLSGENDFAGGIAINGGAVEAQSAKALGLGNVDIAHNGGLFFGVSGVYHLNLVKIAAGQAGTVCALSGVEATPKGIAVGAGSTLNICKDGGKGGGTIVLAGTDSNFGDNSTVSVNYGTLKMGDAGAGKLFDRPGGTLNIEKNGKVDMNGFDVNLNNFTGAGEITTDVSGDVMIHVRSGDYSGQINDGSGKVGVDKIGNGTLRFRGDKNYSGDTLINGGELILDGNLKNSKVSLNNCSKIGGAGTIGALHAKSCATVSPGIDYNGKGGDLKVTGDTVFDKDSHLMVNENDKIKVDGNLDIQGGKVTTKGYLYPEQYFKNIVSTKGDMKGGFNSVAPEYTTYFLVPKFENSVKGVNVRVKRNGITIDSVGRNGNEAKAGRAIESLPARSTLLIRILNSSKAEAQEALKRLSGQVHASTHTAMMQGSGHMQGFMTGRMSGRTGGGAGAGAGAMAQMVGYPSFGGVDSTATGAIGGSQSGASGGLGGLLPFGNFSIGKGDGELWVRGFASTQDTAKQKGGSYGQEMNTTGSFVGLDTPVGKWLLGGALGLSYSDFTNKELVSYGHMRTIYSGLYGSRKYKGVNIRLGGQQNWYRTHTSRMVEFIRYSDLLKSKSNARMTQLFGEAGLPVAFSAGQLEPFAGLSYNYLHNSKMREHGGAAALTGQSGSHDYFSSTLGLRSRFKFYDAEKRFATLSAMLGWLHSYGSLAQTSRMAFAQSQAFDTKGTPLARDAIAAEAGVDFSISDKSAFGVSYNYQYGQRSTDYGIRLNFRTQY